MFSDHALMNHTKSAALFGSRKDSEQSLIKREFVDYEAENNFYNGDNYTYDNDFSIKDRMIKFLSNYIATA